MDDCSCLTAKEGFKYIYVTGKSVLEPFSYKVDHYWDNVRSLIALMVGFRMIAYLILMYKFRKSNR